VADAPRPSVLPSVALDVVKCFFGGLPTDREIRERRWDHRHLREVAGLLEILSTVDLGVLFEYLTPHEGLQWVQSLGAIRSVVQRWERDEGQIELRAETVYCCHRLLQKCPDKTIPPAAPRLRFVADAALRRSLARDVDSLEALLQGEQWKAVTVVGGSVVEALLLSRLLDPRHTADAKAHEAAHAEEQKWSDDEPVPDWALPKMIAVAQGIGLIDDEVATVCQTTRHYRNVIQPGRERAATPCDRATAFAAVAAMESLIRTFSAD
jgi:hypothetical protein